MNAQIHEEETIVPNYYEYTFCRLIKKRAEGIIKRIREGKPSNEEEGIKGVVGTNRVLSLYADSAKNLEFTALEEVDEVGDGYLIRTEGGFNIFNSEGNYYLFKQSQKNILTPSEDKRLRDLIEASALIDSTEIENDEINNLIKNGLTRRKPLAKKDFALMFYTALQGKDDESKANAETFTKEVGKPTKKLINSMSFRELLYFAEDRLKMNLFTPYIDNGYEIEESTQFRLRGGVELDTIYRSFSDKIKSKDFKKDIDSAITEMEEIEKRLNTLDKEDFNLGIFSEKASLKEDILVILRKYENISDAVSPCIYEEENEAHDFYNNIKIDKLTCPDGIDDRYTKRALETSSVISAISKAQPTLLADLGIQTELKKTLFDYGVKTDLKNLVLYAQSLIDITDDVMNKKKKVGEIENKQKDGSSQGFAL